ncbi:MAG TPA: SWIM zinc finger family protein [Iamia sp.]|nr:SWIM zinc finger family protein [Iamia sp.]
MARRTFGHTWWGQAWARALETRARLDPNRLPRGRTYARHDRVRALTVHPGEITAFVQGNRLAPYRVVVAIRRLTDDEWEAVVAAIAGRAAHAAALLDGEIDPEVVADCAAVGVELLPTAGELRPRCSCPDWADPCKHAAAVAYLVADVLDDDPFALFLLRGMARDDLLAAVRAHRRSGEAGGDEVADPEVWPDDPGAVARDVWASPAGVRPAPPPASPLPPRPSPPAPWPTDPPAGAPFTAAGLDDLARDAAHRAWAQLRGDGTSGLDLDAEADLARRAAELRDDVPRFTALARAARVRTADLARRAEAWDHGEVAGLALLDQRPWRPPVATMAEARRRVLEVLGPGAAVVVTDDRITVGPRQLRLGHDGRWWLLVKDRGRWSIAAAPAESPDDLLA